MIEFVRRGDCVFQVDTEYSFRRFLGGGTPSTNLPPVPDPAPTPQEIDIQALEKGEAERRRLRAQQGRASTILTESALGTTAAGKSPILGVVGGTV